MLTDRYYALPPHREGGHGQAFTARTSWHGHRLILLAVVVALAGVATSIIALVHGPARPLANWSTKRPVASSPDCGARGTLRVAAASGIAAVLQTAAERHSLR